jgi:hypothetical protein
LIHTARQCTSEKVWNLIIETHFISYFYIIRLKLLRVHKKNYSRSSQKRRFKFGQS